MDAIFKNFKITATYTGSKTAPWSNANANSGNYRQENWNHHIITVTNTESKLSTRFDFWASIASPYVDTERDAISAFACFISDATAGDQSFREFCDNFGYDEDSRTAERTWKACKRAKEKLDRVYSGDIDELLDALEDYR